MSFPVCFAIVNASEDELAASSSGGAFSIIARAALERGGVVYGHAFTSSTRVACVRADDLDGLARLRGSKYVQSDMGSAMRNISHEPRWADLLGITPQELPCCYAPYLQAIGGEVAEEIAALSATYLGFCFDWSDQVKLYSPQSVNLHLARRLKQNLSYPQNTRTLRPCGSTFRITLPSTQRSSPHCVGGATPRPTAWLGITKMMNIVANSIPVMK